MRLSVKLLNISLENCQHSRDITTRSLRTANVSLRFAFCNRTRKTSLILALFCLLYLFLTGERYRERKGRLRNVSAFMRSRKICLLSFYGKAILNLSPEGKGGGKGGWVGMSELSVSIQFR